ncbi:hypothetical protein MUN84_12930 [Hymenobacter sp. 5516J-16]|nr:hypothetical protein [Hymenobacter sp. 5516J-16]UOQ75589.1 hypothetical protein MUN84_12930 [Hymenobacter sp. 5516J-16]
MKNRSVVFLAGLALVVVGSAYLLPHLAAAPRQTSPLLPRRPRRDW